MSNNTLKFEGLAELREALRKLPEELAAEGGAIVLIRADRAKQDIQASYPEYTGNLRKHVFISKAVAGKYGAGLVVKNTAKHAAIFEFGSVARHYITSNGKKHRTGSMPPGKVFIPIMIRQRRAMYEDLKALLTRAGLEVSGDA